MSQSSQSSHSLRSSSFRSPTCALQSSSTMTFFRPNILLVLPSVRVGRISLSTTWIAPLRPVTSGYTAGCPFKTKTESYARNGRLCLNLSSCKERHRFSSAVRIPNVMFCEMTARACNFLKRGHWLGVLGRPKAFGRGASSSVRRHRHGIGACLGFLAASLVRIVPSLTVCKYFIMPEIEHHGMVPEGGASSRLVEDPICDATKHQTQSAEGQTMRENRNSINRSKSLMNTSRLQTATYY